MRKFNTERENSTWLTLGNYSGSIKTRNTNQPVIIISVHTVLKEFVEILKNLLKKLLKISMK